MGLNENKGLHTVKWAIYGSFYNGPQCGAKRRMARFRQHTPIAFNVEALELIHDIPM